MVQSGKARRVREEKARAEERERTEGSETRSVERSELVEGFKWPHVSVFSVVATLIYCHHTGYSS